MSKHGELGRAAMKADMDRKTARKYREGGCRRRSRSSGLADAGGPVRGGLAGDGGAAEDAPELEAKTLFEVRSELNRGVPERNCGRCKRRVRVARGRGPRSGSSSRSRTGRARRRRRTSLDDASSAVTIAGQLFVHMLCVLVLPYSNWQWATVCLSESMAALRRGVQAALFQLGRVPRVPPDRQLDGGDAPDRARRRGTAASERSTRSTSR